MPLHLNPQHMEASMYYHYCNEPGCPGHIKSWERCDHLRAFGGAGSCTTCVIAGSCRGSRAACPGLSGLRFSATRPAVAGLGKGLA